MKESLGLIEVKGLSAAVYIADVMVKTANVKLLSLERTRGVGWIVIKILGNVGAVNAAINSGKQISMEKNEYVTSKVIPRPSDLIEKVFYKDDCNCEKQEKKEVTEAKKETSKEIEKKVIKNKETNNKETNNKNKVIKNKEDVKK